MLHIFFYSCIRSLHRLRQVRQRANFPRQARPAADQPDRVALRRSGGSPEPGKNPDVAGPPHQRAQQGLLGDFPRKHRQARASVQRLVKLKPYN